MNDTFMLVGEMGGDCPIHGRRGIVWGPGAQRHACGCPMLRGETRLTQSDVHASLANIQGAEEEAAPLTEDERDTFGITEPCTRCELKPAIHKIEDSGIFCDDCVDYAQRVADEEDYIGENE